ncbi:MAG: tRNA guanosine(34) transglycosylase Tgt [Patescibacteria group bacterium]
MDLMGFEIITKDGEARLGRLSTPHGVVETPSYVVVGTDAHVRCLEPADIPETKTQMIISNTYHLWRDLGEEGLATYPGLHAEMGWEGPIMTDSGGFQVFSMGYGREFGVGKVIPREAPKSMLSVGSPIEASERSRENLVRVTDSGVYFMEGGEEFYLDPELSMRIQEQLGADIIFAFDEPSSPLHDYAYTKKAMERTHAWALRSLEAKTSSQLIYGIVQGGLFEDLRLESARFINALPFDGFAIGGAFGSSFGSGKGDTFEALRWVTPLLPEGKPRHLLGIGKIEDLFAAVQLGIDTFDCVIPTREARHGSLWTAKGRFDVVRGRHQNDNSPLAEECGCSACAEGVRKADLYALFKAKDPQAGRFATIHNVYFFNDLMEQIRNAIREGRFLNFKNSYLSK